MHYHFSDTLTHLDVKRHIAHRFAVPERCRGVRCRLRFSPAEVERVKNMLTLTLFDPHGFRGAGHRHGTNHEIIVTNSHASPGYLPGPLPDGEWMIQIDTHMIYGDEPCPYEIDVWIEGGADESATAATAGTPAASSHAPAFDQVVRREAGWYRGDLHTHTTHSDAEWSVADLVAAASEKGLDFVALTDHNTVGGLVEFAERTSGTGLLGIGGMELTTFWGHAVYVGTNQWIDWRIAADGVEMAAIAKKAYERNQVYIIAHPMDIGDPTCTGCHWDYAAMMPGSARLVEVWNGNWRSKQDLHGAGNDVALALWYDWLNAGHRLVATAGSDVHHPATYTLGRPGCTVVYAAELSQRGILDGLMAGHVYLSSGPELQFNAKTDGDAPAMMGDSVAADGCRPAVMLAAAWRDAPANSLLRLIVGGEAANELPVSGAGETTWSVNVARAGWALLELRSADGEMLALTNPIFFNSAM